MATYIVIPPRWLPGILDYFLSFASELHLYTNDYTPGRGDDSLADFTEATATGYAAQVCGGGWTAAVVGGDGIAYKDHIDFEFTCTVDSAVQYVYGWYMTDGGGLRYAAQRGEGPDFPFPFYRAGDKVVVRIRFTYESYGPPPPPAP